MIPESVAALYAFLGLVAPGLLFQLLRERSRPALKESAFREASRVALSSAVFTTASLITLGLLGAWRSTWFPDLSLWLRRGNAYVVDNVALVGRTVLAVVLLSCLYAFIAHSASEAKRLRGRRRIVKTDVWYQLFVEDVPTGMVPWVVIKMGDGAYVWGHVDFFTIGEALGDREISLKGPKLSIECPGDPEPKIEDYYRRICVRAAEVAVMKVAYEPKVEEAKRGWRRKGAGDITCPGASRQLAHSGGGVEFNHHDNPK